MKEDPNPFAALHPTARKVCLFFRGGMRVCKRGIVVAFFGLLGCLAGTPLLIHPWWRGWLGALLAIVAMGCFWLACASAAFAVLFYVLRLIVIALFFMRYSLQQLMGSILFGASCVTMIMKFPDELKPLPVMGLVLLAFIIWIYIIAHDPEDPWFTASFVRRVYGPKQIVEDAEAPTKPKDVTLEEGADRGAEAVTREVRNE